MNNIFANKKILVAGGTGLVGQQLVPKLIKLGAKVFVASLDDKSLANDKIEDFFNTDLMNLDNCIKITKNKEIVFNLLGVTGSPKINIEKPCSDLWRRMFVWWNGDTNPCDVDYKSKLMVGSIKDKNINELWNSESYVLLRNKHSMKKRKQISPCNRCNVI